MPLAFEGEVREIVVSHQHVDASMTSDEVRAVVEPYARAALPEDWISDTTVWHVNPTGKFYIGGPDGDCGLTGRKIIVDTYGGAAPHGGGAFSGKDPSKVDRSAAYAARYLAKNVVAAGLADRCLIQLAYAIGMPEPIAVYVHTYGTGRVDEDRLGGVLRDMVRLTPRGIREQLDLLRPIYARTAAYGAPEQQSGISEESTRNVNIAGTLNFTTHLGTMNNPSGSSVANLRIPRPNLLVGVSAPVK